jgi:hypothetical protein
MVAFAVMLVKDTAMASGKKLTSMNYEESNHSFDSTNYTSSIDGRDGKHYDDVIFFDASLLNAHVTYNLNKKYTVLDASVVCTENTTSGGNFTISFYGDDKLLGTVQNYLGDSTAAKPVSIDVTGVKELKITADNDGTWANGFVYLVNATVSAAKLELSDSTIKLNAKESTVLTWSGEDISGKALSGTAKWKSSDTSVAKVSSKGKVVAVSAGACKITCTVKKTSATATVIVLPSKVTKISTISSGKNFVQLSWKAQSGVSGYKVYMYDTDLEEYTLVKTVKSGNSARIDSLKKNTTYKFKVVAYVKSGSKTYYGEKSSVYKAKTAK